MKVSHECVHAMKGIVSMNEVEAPSIVAITGGNYVREYP